MQSRVADIADSLPNDDIDEVSINDELDNNSNHDLCVYKDDSSCYSDSELD